MLVALENIPEIHNGIVTLEKQYPSETSRSFSNFLMKTSDEVILEKDGSLPKRITFLGHSEIDNIRRYSNYTEDSFVAHIIEQIESAAKIIPEIKSSINNIDLLGCNVGFISKQGCFADEVAARLSQQGYPIRIRAFSNRNFIDTNEYYSMILCNTNSTAQFNVKLFRTKEDKLKYKALRTAKAEAKTQEYKLWLSKKMLDCAVRSVTPTSDVRASLDGNQSYVFVPSEKVDKIPENKNMALRLFTYETVAEPMIEPAKRHSGPLFKAGILLG